MFWYWHALKPEYFNFALSSVGLHYGLGVSNLHKTVSVGMWLPYLQRLSNKLGPSCDFSSKFAQTSTYLLA